MKFLRFNTKKGPFELSDGLLRGYERIISNQLKLKDGEQVLIKLANRFYAAKGSSLNSHVYLDLLCISFLFCQLFLDEHLIYFSTGHGCQR